MATQACPGTSYQFGKESRANGFPVYKPGINHAFKSSHLKSLTNHRPSCNTEFLLPGKYCTNLLAGLMIKVGIYGKYAGGYLCSVNLSDQTGGWGVLYQSCSCSERHRPEMIASPRIRLQTQKLQKSPCHLTMLFNYHLPLRQWEKTPNQNKTPRIQHIPSVCTGIQKNEDNFKMICSLACLGVHLCSAQNGQDKSHPRK